MLLLVVRILILMFGTVAYAETFGTLLDWPRWKTNLVQDFIYYPGALILWNWILEGR